MTKIELQQVTISGKEYIPGTDKSIVDALADLKINDISSDEIENLFEDLIARCSFCNFWTKVEEPDDGSYQDAVAKVVEV